MPRKDGLTFKEYVTVRYSMFVHPKAGWQLINKLKQVRTLMDKLEKDQSARLTAETSKVSDDGWNPVSEVTLRITSTTRQKLQAELSRLLAELQELELLSHLRRSTRSKPPSWRERTGTRAAGLIKYDWGRKRFGRR